MFSDSTIIAIEILKIIVQNSGKFDTSDVLDRINNDKKETCEILAMLQRIGVISCIDNKYSPTSLLGRFSIFELMELVDGEVRIRVGSGKQVEVPNRSLQIKLSMIDTFAQKILNEMKLDDMFKNK